MNKYFAFIGTILIKPSKDIVSRLIECKDNDDSLYDSECINIQKKFYESLSQNCNIFELQWADKKKLEVDNHFFDYMNADEYYVMPTTTPVFFKFNLLLVTESGNEKIYNFSVLYNGVVFFAYTKWQKDSFYSSTPGCELREKLLALFSTPDFSPQIIAPCPLRFSLFNELQYEVDNYIDIDRYVYSKFFMTSYYTHVYSEIMTLCNCIEHIEKDMNDKFRILDSLFKMSINNSIKLMLNSNKLQNLVFFIMSDLANYEERFSVFQKHKKHLLNSLSEDNNIGNEFKEYFFSELKISKFPQGNMVTSINYIEKRLSSLAGNFYLLLSAGIGAILGAIIAKLT